MRSRVSGAEHYVNTCQTAFESDAPATVLDEEVSTADEFDALKQLPGKMRQPVTDERWENPVPFAEYVATVAQELDHSRYDNLSASDVERYTEPVAALGDVAQTVLEDETVSSVDAADAVAVSVSAADGVDALDTVLEECYTYVQE